MGLLPIEAINNARYGSLRPLTDLTHIFHLCSRGRTWRHVVAIICYIPRTRTVAASYRNCSVDSHDGRLVFSVTDFMFIWTCVTVTELYETGAHAMICRSNSCQTLAEKFIDYRVVKLNDSLFLFCDMDAWEAFYKATGRTSTVVSGVLTNATLQPPLAEYWGTAKANRLSASGSCALGTCGPPWKWKWKLANLYINIY